MIGLTDYITESLWEDIFTIWYVLIDDAYQHLIACLGRRLRQRGPEPTFSDSEVITVAMIIETFFGGDEELGLAFLRQYHRDLFPRLLDNGQFNRRRRELTGVMEVIRRQYTQFLIEPNDRIRLIDSAPIPACTYTRNSHCETVVGPEYMSVMVSKKAKLFGHRFYATATLNQVIDRLPASAVGEAGWMLAPAAPNDGKPACKARRGRLTPAFFAMPDGRQDDQTDLFVLGDNAFHVPDEIAQLKSERHITLVAALRKDAKEPLPDLIRRLFNRLRRRIETAFSVMTTVFNLESPGSRSLDGLLCRITTTVLAYNLSFLTNVELCALKTRN